MFSINMCFLVIQNLKSMVNNTNVGDEGGFAPNLENNDEAIKLINQAIEKSGLKPGEDISICLDVAANELYKNKKYSINSKKSISVKKTIVYYNKLIKRYKLQMLNIILR